jgi:hypothetical protein
MVAGFQSSKGDPMYTIQASFAFAEQRPMTYWWPLLCEAMRCQGLGYDNPHYLPAHLGDYYYHYAVDRAIMHYAVDTDQKHEQSFRSMWDDLHAEQCRGIYAIFWSQTEPEVWLASTINQDRETQEIALACSLEYLGEAEAETPEAYTLEASRWVHRWLEVVREIYRLCGPCIAELTHERYGYEYRMGTIGKPLVLEWWDSPAKPVPYEGSIVQERLPDGAILSVVSPLRLPWRGDAIPITLHSEDQSQEPNHSGPK